MRNFSIARDGLTLTATAASSAAALPGDPALVAAAQDVMLWNPGPLPIYVRAGAADVVATQQSMLVPPGTLQPFAKGSATHIAAITAGGSQPFMVWVGEGQ